MEYFKGGVMKQSRHTKKIPLIINGHEVGFHSKEFCTRFKGCFDLFDLDYNEYLQLFKKKLKDKSSEFIYRQSLIVVSDRTRMISPEEVKKQMYLNSWVFNKNARYPYIPDASTVRSYAREAAHIVMQWKAKTNLYAPHKVRRDALIKEAIKSFGCKTDSISKTVMTKIISYVEKRDGGKRPSIQKSISRYLMRINGEK